jgi:C1A family cysteine protease
MATFFKGLVRSPDKDHLMLLSDRNHRRQLQALLATPPPPTWDSVALGWVGPIKDQGQCGSCHDDKTEVLTEKGWEKWENYDWKTPLGTMSPHSGNLEFQAPLRQHIYDYDGPMHFYDGRSLDFALTPNHNMVWSRNKKPWVKSPISELPAYVDIPHATKGWAGTELEKLGIGDRVYDGDDLLALVAVVISDGYVGHNRDGNGGQNQVSFCCFREDRIDMVRSLARRMGIPEMPSKPGTWYLRDGALAEWFRQNAYVGGFTAPSKHVPTLVKCASQRQISHFLKFFGDQHTQAYGGRRFYSCSPLMIDDLQELLLRIGKRGTVEEHPPRSGGINADGRKIEGRHPEFMLTERQRDGLSIERENNKVDHYKGKVYCATVPNGTLVTRRNKRVLISSNCWDFSGTGIVEIAYNKAGVGGGPNMMVLSEEYTLSCCRNGGCGGDDNVSVLDWAKKSGLPMTADYGPYKARAGTCAFKQAMTLYKVDDWGFADGSQGDGVTPTPAIKAAIMQYGAVGIAIAADDAFSNISPGTVFDSTTSAGIDHDVILVGWDDSKGRNGAWKLRNSWGTSWCDGGYCWIGYGVNKVGTEAVWCRINASAPPIDYFV